MLVCSNLVFLCGGFLLFGGVFRKRCVPGTSSKKQKRLGQMCSSCLFKIFLDRQLRIERIHIFKRCVRETWSRKCVQEHG